MTEPLSASIGNDSPRPSAALSQRYHSNAPLCGRNELKALMEPTIQKIIDLVRDQFEAVLKDGMLPKVRQVEIFLLSS